MPFNTSILVYATTRLEFGRFDANVDWRRPYINERSPNRWAEWVHNLKRIAARDGNVVAANNMFDVHYIKYHTGIDAEYLPSWCEPKVGGTESCAADFGTPVGAKACCGQPGRVTEPEFICPSWVPQCVEYREGRHWGKCTQTRESQDKARALNASRVVLLGPYRDNLDFPTFEDEASWRHPILAGLRRAVDGQITSRGPPRDPNPARETYHSLACAQPSRTPPTAGRVLGHIT